MAGLGLKHYRFSTSWPRVCPEGGRRVNSRGLDFYDRLVDALLARGITPWCTLYHWDLPLELDAHGGWTWRGVLDGFEAYVEAVANRLGGRVEHWFTINEFICFIELAYKRGVHAPFRKESQKTVNQAWHHALLAHGLVARTLRQRCTQYAQIGVALNLQVALPLFEETETVS